MPSFVLRLAVVSAMVVCTPALCAEKAPKAEPAKPAPAPAAAPNPQPEPSPKTPGFIDLSQFRDLIDEDKEVVVVNLDGAILQAIAAKKNEDGQDAKELFGKLKSIHAVIGTVKGSAGNIYPKLAQLDQRLSSSGWQRITRIKDEDSLVSVLTHTSGDKIDGLVAIIFDTGDRELVLANLAGEIDLDKIGEIGERLHIGGLDQIPGAR